MRKRLLTFLAFLGLVILSCRAPGLAQNPFQPTPSNVLFQDDFSDPNSGWNRIDSAEGITDYADGVYRIFVNITNSDIWATPGLSFDDVRIEVEATKVGGNDNNVYGLICRYQSSENFYFLVISSDGYYGIGKVKAGLQTLIGRESMPPTDRVNKGNATNHLRADCVGERLTLYVNGERLDERTDSDFATGDVGLFAGAFEMPGTDIHFDNFTVLKP